MPKFHVSIGESFDVDAFEVEDVSVIAAAARASSSLADSKIRGRLALVLLGGAAVALGASALVGYADGTYNEFQSVWSASALFIGLIVERYFPRPPLGS